MIKGANLNLPQLKKFARTIARNYKSKDVVLGLAGPLGAGKTTFTKEFAKAFGIKKIKSPTFIVGSQYPIDNRTLYHFDLYRIDSEKKLEGLDLQEILDGKNRIVIIEWADKFKNLKSKLDAMINFEITGKTTRHVTTFSKTK